MEGATLELANVDFSLTHWPHLLSHVAEALFERGGALRLWVDFVAGSLHVLEHVKFVVVESVFFVPLVDSASGPSLEEPLSLLQFSVDLLSVHLRFDSLLEGWEFDRLPPEGLAFGSLSLSLLEGKEGAKSVLDTRDGLIVATF